MGLPVYFNWHDESIICPLGTEKTLKVELSTLERLVPPRATKETRGISRRWDANLAQRREIAACRRRVSVAITIVDVEDVLAQRPY